MIHVIYLTLIALTAFMFLQVGRRIELGRVEAERNRIEEENHQRSIRRGSIRLSTMKIRR